MKSKRYLRSKRRELELVQEYTKAGLQVYRLSGTGPYNLVTIDTLQRQVTFIEVKATKSSSFRIDRDIRSYPEFGLMTRRVTYDGKVER